MVTKRLLYVFFKKVTGSYQAVTLWAKASPEQTDMKCFMYY